MPSSQPWGSVCYGKDKFIVFPGDGWNTSTTTIFAYSLDGVTWTQGTLTTLSKTGYWRYVCYGKDKFVATASDTNKFVYSLDGIT